MFCHRRALIIQPGALGDGIVTLPLGRLLLEQGGVDAVEIMGRADNLGFLAGRSVFSRVMSLEGTGLQRLFEDHDSFDVPEGDRLVDLLKPYEKIVTFLSDEAGHFERNLFYVANMTSATDVYSLQLRPDTNFGGHVSEYFLSQLAEQFFWPRMKIQGGLLAGPFWNSDSDEGVLGKYGIEGRAVILAPGSGGANKCWPLANFLEMAGRLEAEGFVPVFVLGPVEEEKWVNGEIETLTAAGKVLRGLAVGELAEILRNCAGYAGNDSGLSHLAGICEVLGVVIFGKSNWQHWRPLGNTLAVCVGQDGGWPGVDEVVKTLKPSQ